MARPDRGLRAHLRWRTRARAAYDPEPRVARGERVFARACHACHPHALAGVGPGIIDKPIPAWLVRLQVRIGLGVMPAFPASEIGDEELDDLVAYLDALRRR